MEALRLAVICNVATPAVLGEILTLLVLSEAVTPRGKPLTAKCTVPANPPIEVALIEVLALLFADVLTLRLAGFAASVNEPPGVTVTAILTA